MKRGFSIVSTISISQKGMVLKMKNKLPEITQDRGCYYVNCHVSLENAEYAKEHKFVHGYFITKEQLQVVVDRLHLLADCKNWRLDENSKKIVWIGSLIDPTMVAINALSLLIDTEGE